MKMIDTSHKVFTSKEFIRDKYKFSLISHNLDAATPLMLKSIIFCNKNGINSCRKNGMSNARHYCHRTV